MKQEQLDELNALYVEASLHSDYDFRITVGGNRYQPDSIMTALEEVYRILELELPEVTDEDRKSFIEYHGIDDEDEESEDED